MEVERILTYPIKGMRAEELECTTVTKHGFPWDRRYLILKVQDDGSHKFLAVKLARYFPEISIPPDGDVLKGKITIHHRPHSGDPSSLEIPLKPKTDDLEELEITMHFSPTKAHKMPQPYNDWLTSRLGYPVILVYIADPLRKVLMSTSSGNSRPQSSNNSWLTSLTSKATQLVWGAAAPQQEHRITFADCAPYLIASSKSMQDVDARLPAAEKMDITKFRPNIIVSGAAEAWEEDFWGELTIGGEEKTVILCEQNCGRCKSINIDYETGRAVAPGEAGRMLKKLSKDRRVDPGTKWSPVFGRYAFLDAGSEGRRIGVGDEVVVSRWSAERSVFGECSFHLVGDLCDAC
ncbi:hypothetical protein EJ03DRAFT_264601 [Teratosphaeria nubilosa]|uniref:MOSC domain-containing protein n=1 Tax=Teratosphaeria nubilosa TaxID=161662 RepID=A0A6G1LLH1_9PEZI|nr:hypothetical protein EJ03DRAFT_264601 [Teratosphaeria nubilosa]